MQQLSLYPNVLSSNTFMLKEIPTLSDLKPLLSVGFSLGFLVAHSSCLPVGSKCDKLHDNKSPKRPFGKDPYCSKAQRFDILRLLYILQSVVTPIGASPDCQCLQPGGHGRRKASQCSMPIFQLAKVAFTRPIQRDLFSRLTCPYGYQLAP